jgi:CelD/BcsL family acetyltransferase involved in cellulose biosynthesis
LRIVAREEIPEDSELRRAWNELALRVDRPQVFYTYEWAIAVQRAYGASLTPLIFLGYEGESLVGVAALARKSSGQVVFLNADTGDYCEFLSAESIRQEFVIAVLSGLRDSQIEKVVLTNLPADSGTGGAISHAASKVRYYLHSRPAYACAQVVMGSADERVLLKQSVLAKKRLRRNMRELTKKGPVTLRHDADWYEIESLLQPFTRAHVARFLETGKISNLIREERRAFLGELARELSRSGWIALSRLLVGDATAAWNYGFRFAGCWFWYQPTVNSFYWDFSPGHCLLAKIVELACDSPELSMVDLGLGAEGYKERFANASRPTLYCELNQSLVRHWRAVARHQLAQIATTSPPLEGRIRSVLSSLAEIRGTIASAGFMGTLKRVGHRIRHSLFGQDRVLFFEWPSDTGAPDSPGIRLEPLSSDVLGAAAVQYGNDPASIRFLTRSAQRLRSEGGDGFVLMTGEGMPVHFCWAKEFEGFQMAELDRKLKTPCENAVMIFDCFTPESARGHGFFPQAIAMLATRLISQGKSAWIFGAETNRASVQGIEKSGFKYQFTLGRRRILLFSQTSDSVPLSVATRHESRASTS